MWLKRRSGVDDDVARKLKRTKIRDLYMHFYSTLHMGF